MTRSGIALLVAALLANAPLAAQPATARPPRRERVLVIDSVTVVDVAAKRLVALQRIVMRGDSIVAVQPVSATPPDSIDERIDGRGAFAIPGLVDHHVHITAGMDAALRQAARGGVTMVHSMAGDNRTVGEYARRVLARELAGPEIAYASVMAGPDFFVDQRFRGAGIGFVPGTAPWMQAVTATTDVVRAVAAARGSGAEVLKLYAMIDSALAARLIAEAHRQGMRVVAHGTVFPARPLQLVQGGADILTHAPYLSWQGAPDVRPQDVFDRRMGPYASVPVDGPQITALIGAMKQAGTYLEPTLFVFSRNVDETAVNNWGAALTRKARRCGCADHRRHRRLGRGRQHVTPQCPPRTAAAGERGTDARRGAGDSDHRAGARHASRTHAWRDCRRARRGCGAGGGESAGGHQRDIAHPAGGAAGADVATVVGRAYLTSITTFPIVPVNALARGL